MSWLETFVVASESASRSEAAKKLGMSQGAVTKHIQNLEWWCQRVLFRPKSVPPKLTRFGEALRREAEPILKKLGELRKLAESPPPREEISVKDLRVPPSVPDPSKG